MSKRRITFVPFGNLDGQDSRVATTEMKCLRTYSFVAA
jgi:hypothetical protein